MFHFLDRIFGASISATLKVSFIQWTLLTCHSVTMTNRMSRINTNFMSTVHITRPSEPFITSPNTLSINC